MGILGYSCGDTTMLYSTVLLKCCDPGIYHGWGLWLIIVVVVERLCCGLASPKPNFRVSTPIWTWQISVLSIWSAVMFVILSMIRSRLDLRSGIYDRSRLDCIYDMISDPFLILPCFSLTSLISCHLTSWTASPLRHVHLMLDTCS